MWLIVGLIAGAGVLALVLWSNNRGISIKWYEWFIGIVGIALLLFTIQNYGASLNEFESGAATTFLLVTGLPAVILLAIAGGLAFMRNRSTA
jgi:hypothetical protein